MLSKERHQTATGPLFDLADDKSIPALVDRFVSASFKPISELGTLSFSIGQEHAQFLDVLFKKLDDNGKGAALKSSFSKTTLPSDPEYLFGLAAQLSDTAIGFADFGSIPASVGEDDTVFENFATEYPTLAFDAFKQFREVDLLKEEHWITIGNACILVLYDPNADLMKTSAIWAVVLDIWKYVEKDSRQKLTLPVAFSNGQLFHNLGDVEDLDSSDSVPSLYFLAADSYLDKDLPVPKKKNPSGQMAPDNSPQFLHVKGLLKGEFELSERQAIIVAKHARDVKRAGLWITHGSENPINKATVMVIRAIINLDELPLFRLGFVTKHFDYLKGLVGEEVFAKFLSRLDDRITDVNIAELGLEDVPIGFLPVCSASGGHNFKKLPEHVSKLLKDVSGDEWLSHLTNLSHHAQMLNDLLLVSDVTLPSSKYRRPFLTMVSGVLSGSIAPVAQDAAYDRLFGAIGESYHTDVWRSLREDMQGVSETSLALATELFPNLLKQAIGSGDRIMKAEKDNVVRHILCSALEGGNEVILKNFIELGSTRVSDYIASSEESTKRKLEGAWATFSNSPADREWIKSVGEVVIGRKRTRTWWGGFTAT